jgi:Predicted metal-dependent enzyme
LTDTIGDWELEAKNELNYGGQAVMEGVMMRGSRTMAVAVRQPDGHILLHSEPLDPRIYLSRVSKIPFLRALTGLWDVLVLGIRTLF